MSLTVKWLSSVVAFVMVASLMIVSIYATQTATLSMGASVSFTNDETYNVTIINDTDYTWYAFIDNQPTVLNIRETISLVSGRNLLISSSATPTAEEQSNYIDVIQEITLPSYRPGYTFFSVNNILAYQTNRASNGAVFQLVEDCTLHIYPV